MNTQKLTRDQKLLIAFSALRNVTELFLGTFLISFIMHLAANQILSVSIYNLFQYVTTCAGFFLFANWCKRRNKVTVFAMHLIPKVALLLSIIILGDRCAEYVIPLGVLYGISAAMYYLPANTMTGEKVHPKMMNRYIGTRNAINYAVKIIAPMTLGFFISEASYVDLAYVLLAVVLVELILMRGLTPSHHKSKQGFDIAGFCRCIFRFPVIRRLFAMEIMRGFGLGLLSTVITMYTVYMFKTDLNLGIFTTIFAGCSIVTSWAFGRWGKQKYWPYILGVAMLIIMGAISLFVYNTTPITFLVYNLVYATAIIVIDQASAVNVFRLSRSRCVTANHKIEYFVFRDAALFIGRWIGFVGLMYIGVFGGYDWLRWYLVVITGAILLCGAIAIQLVHKQKK